MGVLGPVALRFTGALALGGLVLGDLGVWGELIVAVGVGAFAGVDAAAGGVDTGAPLSVS